MEQQLAALTAALGDSDETGIVQSLKTTIADMKASIADANADADADEERDSDAATADEVSDEAETHASCHSEEECHGYSCDDWISRFQVSCAVLETDFGCSCKGCRGCAGAGAGRHRGTIDESAIAHLASSDGSGSEGLAGSSGSSSSDSELPEGWFEAVDTGSGRTYFYNNDGQTQWDRPTRAATLSSVADDSDDSDETDAEELLAQASQLQERPTLPDGVLPPLFISEHSSGPGTQCVLEIFNPAKFPVPLGLYTLRVFDTTQRGVGAESGAENNATAPQKQQQQQQQERSWSSVPDLALPWDVIVDPQEVVVLATSMASFKKWGKVRACQGSGCCPFCLAVGCPSM